MCGCRGSGNPMLRDPTETAWRWPTSKAGHNAASTSEGAYRFDQDARVPACKDTVGAVDPDVLELTFKNDVRC